MNKLPVARDIMRTRLITLTEEMSLLEAARAFLQHGISGAPVIDKSGNILGILTEHDVLLPMAETALEGDPLATVGARMARDLRTADPEMDVLSLSALFGHNHVRSVPVLEGDTLVGLVMMSDLVKLLADWIDPVTHSQSHPGNYVSRVEDAKNSPINAQ